MSATVAGQLDWGPVTEEETKAVADALNAAAVRCCVRDCTEKRIGWEAVKEPGGFLQLRGIGFCPTHFAQIKIV